MYFFHGRPPSCLEFSLKHVTSDLDWNKKKDISHGYSISLPLSTMQLLKGKDINYI